MESSTKTLLQSVPDIKLYMKSNNSVVSRA